MAGETVIVGDIESNGLEHDAKIIEIAWVEINNKLEVVEEFDSLIDPEEPISAHISGITNITNDDVKEAPTISEFFEYMCPECLTTPTILIAHNAPFDLKFFKRHTDKITDTLCTMRLARRLFPELENHKLPTLKYHFKLGKSGGHRALYDVLVTLDLLRIMLNHTGLTLPELIKEAKRSVEITHMPFGKHKGAPLAAVPMSYREWLLKSADNLDPDLKRSLEKLRMKQ